jgi:hypothetical protein
MLHPTQGHVRGRWLATDTANKKRTLSLSLFSSVADQWFESRTTCP